MLFQRTLTLLFKKQKQDKALFTVALMIFFFVIFDGVLMYLAPIIMTKHGVKEGTVGLILGLSSVAGMLFDVLLGKVVRNVTYRTIFFCMIFFASLYPLFLFQANTISLYLVAMAVWGLYYNLYNVGTLDFVSRSKEKSEHVFSFGILKVFDGLGYLIAPFLGSLILSLVLLGGLPSYQVLLLLIPSLLFYFILLFQSKSEKGDIAKNMFGKGGLSLFKEFHIWEKVGKKLLPLLLLTLIINTVDSAVWTIGPLFSESLQNGHYFKGSFFMLAYTVPPLLVGWFVSRSVRRFGKKKIAVVTLAVGSGFLSLVGFVTHPYLLLCIIFGASFCFSLAWPSINSVYSDDMTKSHEYHEEIESVEDLFTNAGDVLGPILAGYIAEYTSNTHAFFVIGLLGAATTTLLYAHLPQNLEGDLE